MYAHASTIADPKQDALPSGPAPARRDGLCPEDISIFREDAYGNVPAKQEPLNCAQQAFATLPDTVEQRFFRGD